MLLHWWKMEDFPSLGIYKFDLSGMRFQTSFGGGNLNVNDFHHQIRFGIWNETVYSALPERSGAIC
jgi:hypothetical protein